MFNDILDLASIDMGTLTFNHGNFNIRDIINEIFKYFELSQGTKRIEVSINHDSKLPTMIRNDQKRLIQVLLNLVANAFKFTPDKGKISISTEFIVD